MRRPPPSLRGRALMWLSQREHSRQELRLKLQRWAAGLPEAAPGLEDDIEPLLDALQAAGHLCDARFVESRIHARVARFGNRRIEQELRHHGAPAGAEALRELRASEAGRARHVRAARFGPPPADAAERARQMRFLAARGFSSEAVRQSFQPDDAEDA